VRAVLLPATMTVLGDWNWYLPRWLEWLPRVTAETLVEAPAPAPPAEPAPELARQSAADARSRGRRASRTT
jgi:hypothetical protein